ncbi:hypothetical protein Q3H58_004768 [Pseudomonas psychrotolerans]|nr:hypothetical protein [Pseudomonas psychrotolerans]
MPSSSRFDLAIVEGQFEPQVGPTLGQLQQDRRQAALAEQDRHAQSQPATRSLAITCEFVFRALQFGQDAQAALIEQLTFRGELLAARGALKQRHAQLLLQTGHSLADRRT